MPDQPQTTPGPEGKGKGKKILGMPPWALALGIAVTGGGILYFLYERRKAAATAAAGGAGATPGQICYDSAGNQVPCTDSSAVTDQSGEISTLQTEIADIQGQLAGAGSGGGGGDNDGGGGSGGGGSSVPWDQNAANIAADAQQALIRSGVKHPTKAQIREERRDILQTARQGDSPHRRPRPPRRRRIDRPRRRVRR